MKTLLLCSILFSAQAFAADHVLKWGVNVEPIDYFKKAAISFKERVEKRTNGKVEVQLSLNAVTQEGHNHLGDIQNGTYHMGQETVFNLQRQVPELAIWNLPFLFRDDKHVISYMNSVHAKKNLAKLQEFGVTGITYTYSGGFLYIAGDKINSFSDLKNKRLGLEGGGGHAKDYQDFLKLNLKITSADFDFSELNTGLSGLEIIASTGRDVFPYAKNRKLYLNLTDHRVISRVLFISSNFLETLPENLRNIVLEEAKRAGEFERDLSIEDKYLVVKEAKKQNISINEWSSKQKQSEKKKFKSYYEEYVKRFGTEALKYIIEEQ